jgi:hypothetical protein
MAEINNMYGAMRGASLKFDLEKMYRDWNI